MKKQKKRKRKGHTKIQILEIKNIKNKYIGKDKEQGNFKITR